MLDLKRRDREMFRCVTIGATIFELCPNGLPQFGRNVGTHLGSEIRFRECIACPCLQDSQLVSLLKQLV